MANTSNRPVQLGDRVAVISGPHEGRSGQVVRKQDLTIGFSDPEPYVIVEYPDADAPGGKDAVSVPARRCQLR